MNKEIQARYVSLLRSLPDTTSQLREAELVITDEYIYMDAYAILASLYMAENDGLIGFVPVHRQVCLSAAPEFYFYLRDELIRWSGLTDNDLNDLITWNDVMELSFAEIADQIEKEWV